MKAAVTEGWMSFKKAASVMRSLHWMARRILKARGYSWELRRNGELKLGFWKKTLKSKDQRRPYPKRFVLIPGFGDTPLSWYFVMVLLHPILKSQFDEIILFDFPAFAGFLSKEKSFPTMDLMRKMLNDTLDSLKPHTILAHSLGGWLAGHYAAECGAGVRPTSNKLNYSGPHTLILANPSGVYKNEAAKEMIVSIFRHSRLNGFAVLRPHLFAKEPKWFSWLAADFQNFIEREDVQQFMDSVREDHVLEKSIHQIKARVWLIWGEKDTLVPVQCSTAWLECLNEKLKAEHQAIILPHSGHSPHIEQPAVTAAVIAQILSKKIPHRLGKRCWKVIGQEQASF